ncbi:putative membrane protein [Desulfosarcina variabilis str. Montpellier]|uniref:OmpP1/FadL family transporter n=1 Tax=Desulfosarcina variabilis TaxID=2300 RepID=UPI003AFB71A5
MNWLSNRILKGCIYSILVFIFTNLPVLADPWISYPGTRARSMGGAFTAVADDSSAIWYNPAGLTGKKGIDVIVEYSQAVDIENSEFTNGENKFFVAADFRGKKIGLGIAYFSPYTISWNYPESTNSIYGTLKEDINVLSFGLAFPSFNERLKIGGTVELVTIDYGDSSLYRDSYGYTYQESNSDSSTSGFSGSIGVLLDAIKIDSSAFTMKIGGVYRFKTSVGDTKTDDEIEDNILFGRPPSYELGLSMAKGITRFKSTITASVQYGNTDWSEANSNDYSYRVMENRYDKVSFGLEWTKMLEGGIKYLSLRAGYYSSKPDEDYYYPEVTGITGGVGLKLGKYFAIEATYENRNMEMESYFYNYNQRVGLYSVALTWSK